MRNKLNYYIFLKENGKSLAEINQGSYEMALTVEDALQALELLKDSKTIILGGDILSEDENGKLAYVIYFWGYEYIYLNWYLTTEDYENKDYLKSYILAKNAIINAKEAAEKLKKKCYIVFVTD